MAKQNPGYVDPHSAWAYRQTDIRVKYGVVPRIDALKTALEVAETRCSPNVTALLERDAPKSRTRRN